jgi:hypothetical protein
LRNQRLIQMQGPTVTSHMLVCGLFSKSVPVLLSVRVKLLFHIFSGELLTDPVTNLHCCCFGR